MPYIHKEKRQKYTEAIESILLSLPEDSKEAAGEFTYVLYNLLKRFNGKYWERALGTGAAVMALFEMYRRDHAPYEEGKIADHGDL